MRLLFQREKISLLREREIPRTQRRFCHLEDDFLLEILVFVGDAAERTFVLLKFVIYLQCATALGTGMDFHQCHNTTPFTTLISQPYFYSTMTKEHVKGKFDVLLHSISLCSSSYFFRRSRTVALISSFSMIRLCSTGFLLMSLRPYGIGSPLSSESSLLITSSDLPLL